MLERPAPEVDDDLLAVRQRHGRVQAALVRKAREGVTAAHLIQAPVQREPHALAYVQRAAIEVEAEANDVASFPSPAPLGHHVVPLVLAPAVVTPRLGPVADAIVGLITDAGEGHVRPAQLHATVRHERDLVVPLSAAQRAAASAHRRESSVIHALHGEIGDVSVAADRAQRIRPDDYGHLLHGCGILRATLGLLFALLFLGVAILLREGLAVPQDPGKGGIDIVARLAQRAAAPVRRESHLGELIHEHGRVHPPRAAAVAAARQLRVVVRLQRLLLGDDGLHVLTVFEAERDGCLHTAPAAP
mmetsp:Transcript_8310/g.23755  ORF Transcript_8310/g.23755 Transcript_8310/m.23755 type:complete len:303 (-) Transcript_8310:4095-5003(-)